MPFGSLVCDRCAANGTLAQLERFNVLLQERYSARPTGFNTTTRRWQASASETAVAQAVPRDHAGPTVPVSTRIRSAIGVLVDGYAVHSSDALFLELQQCPISARSVPIQCPLTMPFWNRRGI